MKIFVISLPESVDRRESISTQMKLLGLDFEFVDGVLVKQVASVEHYDEKGRYLRYGYGLSSGEVGCFLAHRLAWQRVSAEHEKCLVLEDDALISGLSTDLMNKLATSPYPVVRLAGIFRRRYRQTRNSSYFKYWGDPSGAAAYILGAPEAKKLLETSEKFYMAVDDFLEARYLHGIHTYAYLPYPVRQSGAESEIERLGRGARPELSFFTRLRIMLLRIPRDIRKYVYRVAYYF